MGGENKRCRIRGIEGELFGKKTELRLALRCRRAPILRATQATKTQLYRAEFRKKERQKERRLGGESKEKKRRERCDWCGWKASGPGREKGAQSHRKELKKT